MRGHVKIIKQHPTASPRKEMCQGCRNNFYNGNNNLGVEECWSFSTAEVCDKIGYHSIHSVKHDETKIKTLNCWHAVSK